MRKVTRIEMEVTEWDELVATTYNRPYSFQQQNDCRDRGSYHIQIPNTEEDFQDDVARYPDLFNNLSRNGFGVSFQTWLKETPMQYADTKQKLEETLWWHRHFYPNEHVIAQDLYKRGLLEAGDYVIEVDW